MSKFDTFIYSLGWAAFIALIVVLAGLLTSFIVELIDKRTKLKQSLCGLTNHYFLSNDTECKYDKTNKTYTITETCCKCGKKYSFTAPAKNFGLREEVSDD